MYRRRVRCLQLTSKIVQNLNRVDLILDKKALIFNLLTILFQATILLVERKSKGLKQLFDIQSFNTFSVFAE